MAAQGQGAFGWPLAWQCHGCARSSSSLWVVQAPRSRMQRVGQPAARPSPDPKPCPLAGSWLPAKSVFLPPIHLCRCLSASARVQIDAAVGVIRKILQDFDPAYKIEVKEQVRHGSGNSRASAPNRGRRLPAHTSKRPTSPARPPRPRKRPRPAPAPAAANRPPPATAANSRQLPPPTGGDERRGLPGDGRQHPRPRRQRHPQHPGAHRRQRARRG